MRPVGPEIPAFMAPHLQEINDAIAELQQPTKPAPAFRSTFAALPPAADYKFCTVLVTDKNAFATSTLVASTWTWLRADGTAL